jgi:RNA:NAD 2'-phosphotransferase (TPT1/KptA family)
MSRRIISKEVQISKTLSYLLRHGAVNEGIEISQGI